MRGRWLIRVKMYEVLAMLFAWLGAWGQAPAVPAAKDADAKGAEAKQVALGSYSLVTTATEASGAAHWLNPPLTIEVPAGTEYVPAEAAGNLTVPAQFAADGFGPRRYECVADAPKGGGCKALDETELTIRDANTVGYHIVTHGAAVKLTVNLEVRDILPVSRGGPSWEWYAGEVIFVTVPKATGEFHFVSEVLVGDWNGEAIVFEVGKDLPESAKKGLEDLGVKQDLGDRVLYSFRVRKAGSSQ